MPQWFLIENAQFASLTACPEIQPWIWESSWVLSPSHTHIVKVLFAKLCSQWNLGSPIVVLTALVLRVVHLVNIKAGTIFQHRDWVEEHWQGFSNKECLITFKGPLLWPVRNLSPKARTEERLGRHKFVSVTEHYLKFELNFCQPWDMWDSFSPFWAKETSRRFSSLCF